MGKEDEEHSPYPRIGEARLVGAPHCKWRERQRRIIMTEHDACFVPIDLLGPVCLRVALVASSIQAGAGRQATKTR
jgi:hypothetical protein